MYQKVFYDKIKRSMEAFYYGKQKEKRVQTNDRVKKKFYVETIIKCCPAN